MLPAQIILKKRNGKTLNEEELEFFIDGFVKGEIHDYQMAAFLMAVYFRGMTDEETAVLTRVMLNSGDIVDLSAIPGVKVDKHSTGGVGDTTTLVLAPLVAAAGIPVAKMSGRGLGHTGGTLDKMESIPGLTVDLSIKQFISQVQSIGLAIIGQTADLVPADKKIYALRDVTGTIDSIPLIAGSIMSKKIASGADAIVLDVKTGNGAFMAKKEDAVSLAKIMVDIGKLMNRKTVALITDMSQPLGSHIGNALEVKEAIEILKGMHKNSPLYRLSLTLGSYMLILGGVTKTPEEGYKILADLIKSGDGIEKLRQMIKAQRGNPNVTEDLSLLPKAVHVIDVPAPKGGFVKSFVTTEIGHAALILGAGRIKKDTPIDPAVGLIVNKRIGDKIETGEPLAQIYANDLSRADKAKEIFIKSVKISEEKPDPPKLVYEVVGE